MCRAVAGWIVGGNLDYFGEKGALGSEAAVDDLADLGFESGCHDGTGKFNRKSLKARAARSASSALSVSEGWWLMPPLPQRTNSMPISVMPAMTIASCPAPLGRCRTSAVSVTRPMLAAHNCCIFGAQGTLPTSSTLRP